MLDLKWIRDHVPELRKAILEKRIECDLDALLELDHKVVETKKRLQSIEEEKNRNAKQVPQAKPEDRASLIERGRELNLKIESERSLLRNQEEQLQFHLWKVPNIPSSKAPRGVSEEDNVELKKVGTPPVFHGWKPKHHVDLLEKNHWAELERVAKISGSRSYALKNEMVSLEMALLQFALDSLDKKGFTLISLPAMTQEAPLYGTGHFPTGRDQVYFLPDDHLYLVGTAEVPINSLHAGEILKETECPLLYAGFSSCFRREAGSAGRDTRGLIRVHQFFKVEQFVICKNDPAEARHWHETLLQNSEDLMQALELPYRVMDVCTGDMGAGKVRQYDIEAWVPSEQKYRETHSCSSLYDWQARRAQLRYRDTDGKVQFCYTLNNTAIASPRILVPFLENHQQEDGSIRIPEALRCYLGGRAVLKGH